VPRVTHEREISKVRERLAHPQVKCRIEQGRRTRAFAASKSGPPVSQKRLGPKDIHLLGRCIEAVTTMPKHNTLRALTQGATQPRRHHLQRPERMLGQHLTPQAIHDNRAIDHPIRVQDQ
jgi:hypothetical protein